MNAGAAEALVRRLDSIADLTPAEREAVRGLPMHLVEVPADLEIVREGDRPSHCCLILDGFACIAKNLRDGSRQITAFQIPGDIPDLLSVHLHVLDSSISMLTPCSVAYILHKDIRDLCRDFPGLASAFWRSTLIDGSVFREWMANIGQRPAPQRLAHLFCEFLVRMRSIGLADDQSCAFPITQTELGEATGMTSVHVNRSLNQLREAGLIRLQKSRLVVLDWDGLSAAGDFESSYLHLRDSRQAHR